MHLKVHVFIKCMNYVNAQIIIQYHYADDFAHKAIIISMLKD